MIDLKRILFPTDFGESAEQALHYAAMLAEEYGAELVMMNVVSLFGEEGLPPEDRLEELDRHAAGYLEQLHGQARQKLERAVEEQVGRGIRTRKLIARGFSPYREILRVAEEQQVDLIVMGTYGRGGVTHFLFGSTAEQVVRMAPCPVLSVRHHAPHLTRFNSLRNILFPTDFSNYSKRALPYALSFAARYGARLHVLHVFEQRIHPAFYLEDKTTPLELDEGLHQRALEALRELVVSELQGRSIDIRYEVAAGKPFVEIINYARAAEIDLIAVATHGLTGLEYMVIGSTTERVVRKAPCPVLSVKDPEHEFVKP